MDKNTISQSIYVAIVLIFVLNFANAANLPTVKVRIGRDIPKIKISGLDLKRELLYNSDNSFKQYQGSKSVEFNCDKISANILKKKSPIQLASLSSPTGLVSWGDNRYRGELIVQTTPNKKGCDVVNVLSLEHYISSLLAKEMQSSWPQEALKAQAVAARTYAYYKMLKSDSQRGYQLINSEVDQVNGSFFDETISTFKAATDTESEILIADTGRLTPIFYHSQCGDVTLTPDMVWGNKVDSYKSVKTNFEHNSDAKKWKYSLSKNSFANFIDIILEKSNRTDHRTWSRSGGKIRVVPDKPDKITLRVYRGSNLFLVSKSEVRKQLGRKNIPSNYFSVISDNQNIVFEGKGKGHGVGMCQYGALELAERGQNYKQILKYFFPSHELVTIEKTI